MRGPQAPAPDFESILGPGGGLSKRNFFEHRPGQVAMAKGVWETLVKGGTLLVEAGTGIGKSLAYLVPSALFDRRIVISTGTKALQEQLILKDIPLLEELLEGELRTVVMKGRANYLCRYYWDKFKAEPLLDSAAEAPFFKRIEEWVPGTPTGDRADLEGVPEDLPFWKEINARGDRCLGSHCPFYSDCFVTVLKRRAEGADLVVVNHHLLFADLALRSRWDVTVIPDYGDLILDEAHEAGDAAVSFFGTTVSKRMLQELCHDIQKGSGSPPDSSLVEASRTALETGLQFFGAFGLEQGRVVLDSRGSSEERVGIRQRMEVSLDRAALRLESLKDVPEALGLMERIKDLVEAISFILDGTEEDYVRWMDVRGSNVILGASPIEVSGILRESLFEQLRSTVMTSATLTVGGSFDFIRKTLGVPEEIQTEVIPSPFDYHSQSLLYIPEKFPDPGSADFLKALMSGARKLVEASSGRAFVLCTSYRNMEAVAEDMEKWGRYPVLVQGREPKGILLDRFRKAGNAVLVATSSFWQGVDVQGEALSLVILDKIPFAVPGDPLEAARIEKMKSRGENPFSGYQLPSAAIMLKQGLGRLIRSEKDRGVVACMDVRIRSRSYGRVLLKSLPPYGLTGSMDDVRQFYSLPF